MSYRANDTAYIVEPSTGQVAHLSLTIDIDNGRGGSIDHWMPPSVDVVDWEIIGFYDDDGNEIDESDVCKELLVLVNEEMTQ